MTNDQKLIFYALHMTIEYGDVMGKQPPISKYVDLLKWRKWDEVAKKNFSKYQLLWQSICKAIPYMP